MGTVKVGIVQLPRRKQLDANVERAIEALASAEADVKLLPENWASAEPLSREEHDQLLAKLMDSLSGREVLVAGAHYVKDEGKVVSTASVLTSRGVEAVFEKRHPSKAVGERGWLMRGRGGVVFEAKGVLMGGLVCIDLMYPEEVRCLTLRGALIILNPASVSIDRVDLWRCIGRCRAAENTVFVASAINTYTTYFDNRPVMGGSFIASPEGTLILDAGVEPGVYVADLDLSWIDRVRAKWGYLEEVEEDRGWFLRLA